MENDLDFRKDDLVYWSEKNVEGYVEDTEGGMVIVFFNSLRRTHKFRKNGTRSCKQVLFHDPDRFIKVSISDYTKSISKPPKRMVKRYFNLFTNNTYNSYLSKDDAEKCHRYKGIPSVEYYAVAVEAEVLEDE